MSTKEADQMEPINTRRPSKIDELREKIEAQTKQRTKKPKNSRSKRNSFHDNIYFKQDREKVINLIKESQNKTKPKKKKKKIIAKGGKKIENGAQKDKKVAVSNKKINNSTRNIKTKKNKTQSKRVIKNSYLKKGKDKVLIGTKGAKKIVASFKKKKKLEELTEIEVPDFSNLSKMNKSTSPKTKKKAFRKSPKISRMSSPKRKNKKTQKIKQSTGNLTGEIPKISNQEEKGRKDIKKGSVDELNDLISNSKNLHDQLEKSITKEKSPKPINKGIKKSLSTVMMKKPMKKSRSELNIKKTKSRTPNKRKLKNSSTIKNLKGKSISRKGNGKSVNKKLKRRKSKSITRGTFSTKKHGEEVEEVVFATEKKFMRMKSARRIRPKEEYESGIPLRQKGKGKIKLKKKTKKKKIKSKKKLESEDVENVSFDGDYESGFISEIQTRAILPNQTPNSKIVYDKTNVNKIPETAATVKKDINLTLQTSEDVESPEKYLQSLILEGENESVNRESISYKYFQTDGKFSDNDEQAELKNSLFMDNYMRQQETDNKGLLSEKFVDLKMENEYNADQIFEEIKQKTNKEEVNETLDKIQSFHEKNDKNVENDIYKFIESKKQSTVDSFEEKMKLKTSQKVKIISQQNIDFEGLIENMSNAKKESSDLDYNQKAKSSLNKIFHKAMSSDKVIRTFEELEDVNVKITIPPTNIISLNELAKERVRTISHKVLKNKKLISIISDKKNISQTNRTSILKEPENIWNSEFSLQRISSKFCERISIKAIQNFNKKVQKKIPQRIEIKEKPKTKIGMLFSGGKVTNQFNNLRGRSSVAMLSMSVKKSFKLNSLVSIEEKKKPKPFCIKDLVKRNTKLVINNAKIETKKIKRQDQEEERKGKVEEKPIFTQNKEPIISLEIGDEYKKQNWIKNYLKNLSKKVTTKMEFTKMDEDMDLIKSKIEITENNIKNDLQFFQDMLDQEEEEEQKSKKTFGSKIDVSKYFSKEESIILEENEEEYYTYEDSQDSMEDLRSIDFSKKTETMNEETKKEISIELNNVNSEKLPKIESLSTPKNFDFNLENTTSIYIKKNCKTEEKPSPKPSSKPKPQSDSFPLKEKPKKIIKKTPSKPSSKPKLSVRNSTQFTKNKAIKSKKSIESQKQIIRESIRHSKIMKINTVTDFDLKQVTSDSESDSDDSDWEDKMNKDVIFDESNRSSRPSRLDSDYFLHKKGDTHILRILHESQRIIDVMKDEEKNGSIRMSGNEMEKFQKSQKIYFKESDLKELTQKEKDIRRRIKTSNRLIKHIDQKEPKLEDLSPKDVSDMKLLIEEPFKYKSFDKLTENEKNERIELEVRYKKKIVERINKIVETFSGKRQSELVTKEIMNVVSGRTLHRWNSIQKGELTAILKIQRFFRFKIEERIGKKILEMQKQYYQTRASIINPPK
jgi:hypothetical protein